MSERYTRLFALEENLYSEGSPIVISAGALLKDNRTGAVLAQLKIKNISCKVIKAAVVCLTAYDAFGKIIDGTVEKKYLDLAVERDAEFGQKVLIPLPDAAARVFTAAVTCVGFADNTIWNYAGEEQTALPHPKLLAETLGESELVKQYQIKYGVRAKVFPEAYKDVWFCACGALCRADEGLCHTCGNKRSELLSFDREALTAEKDERLEKEAAARKKAEEKAEAARRIAKEEAAARIKRKKKIAAITIPVICVCIAFGILLTQVIIPKQRYNKAMGMINAGEYDSAYAMLEELGKTEAIAENKYDRAMKAIDARDYDFAYALLEEIGNNEAIAENKYDRAMECVNEQDYETALSLLNGLNYKDSKTQRINATYQRYKSVLESAAVGDTIFFGSYEQDNDTSNGKEDIEWLVLAKEENRLLITSQYALDCQPYNIELTSITWEKSTLRQWLNERFFNAAFSDGEKDMILAVTVFADKNPEHDTDSGNPTTDKVFLLSIAEANKYFSSHEARMCVPTAYAKSNGAKTSSNYAKDGATTCFWWLRSPGGRQDGAAYVSVSGDVNCYGNGVRGNSDCVRPAMWIDLGT